MSIICLYRIQIIAKIFDKKQEKNKSIGSSSIYGQLPNSKIIAGSTETAVKFSM